jgi:hypothetical protein
MIAVIQCAATKRSGGGYLLSAGGLRVIFVADPAAAPPKPTVQYARPDDQSGKGMTWRQELLRYNSADQGNPLGLLPAYMLYRNSVYERLVDRIGIERVYVLSAGWGLIRADFLTPYYDITFSSSAEPYKRRGKNEYYQDFRVLPSEVDEQIVFFGGKDYRGLFSALTEESRSTRTVFYNSADVPKLIGCRLIKFETPARTNWHYQCANALLDGKIDLR